MTSKKLTEITAAGSIAASDRFYLSRSGSDLAATRDFLLGSVYNVKHASAKGDNSTDDRTAIQSAIDAAEVAGGTVVVPPGTYLVSLTASNYALLIDSDNVTFHLTAGATIKLMDGEIAAADSVGYVLQIGDGTNPVTNVSVTGPGCLDYNGDNQTHTGVSSGGIQERAPLYVAGPNINTVIDGVELKNSLGDGIYCRGHVGGTTTRLDHISILRNRVHDCREGILCMLADYLNITNNHVYDISGTGAQDGIEPTRVSYFAINNNLIENVAQSGIDVFDATESGTISGNVLHNVGAATGGDGITFGGVNSSLPTNQLVISDNVIDAVGTGATGIGIASVQDNTNENSNVAIVGNTIIGANIDGIKLWDTDDNILVSNNIIKDCQENGMELRGNNCQVVNNTIFNNNQAAGNNDGLLIVNATSALISGNMIFDDQVTTTQRNGIFVATGSSRLSILNNDIRGHDDRCGIEIDTGNHIVKGNTCIDNLSDLGQIRIDGDGNDVAFNHVVATTGTPNYGINILGDNNFVMYNRVTGHDTTDVRDAGTGNTTTGNY